MKILFSLDRDIAKNFRIHCLRVSAEISQDTDMGTMMWPSRLEDIKQLLDVCSWEDFEDGGSLETVSLTGLQLRDASRISAREEWYHISAIREPIWRLEYALNDGSYVCFTDATTETEVGISEIEYNQFYYYLEPMSRPISPYPGRPRLGGQTDSIDMERWGGNAQNADPVDRQTYIDAAKAGTTYVRQYLARGQHHPAPTDGEPKESGDDNAWNRYINWYSQTAKRAVKPFVDAYHKIVD